MLSVTHFLIQEDVLNKHVGCCWMVQVCSVAPECTLAQGAWWFWRFRWAQWNKHQNRLREETQDVCVRLWWRRMALLKDRIEPATRHECVFIKRVLVWIYGQLRVPPSVLVEVVCFKIIICICALKLQEFPPIIKDEASAMLFYFCLCLTSHNSHKWIVEKENKGKKMKLLLKYCLLPLSTCPFLRHYQLFNIAINIPAWWLDNDAV